MKKQIAVVAGGLVLATGAQLGAVVDFDKQLKPLLEANCINCHAAPYKKGSRLRKPKGDYRVDTRENILKAGESEEPGIVPGNSAKSQVYKRVILPEDHDDIMPAKGDPLTPAQQKILKDWIDAGAKIVGGCCGIGPAHISALSAELRDR